MRKQLKISCLNYKVREKTGEIFNINPPQKNQRSSYLNQSSNFELQIFKQFLKRIFKKLRQWLDLPLHHWQQIKCTKGLERNSESQKAKKSGRWHRQHGSQHQNKLQGGRDPTLLLKEYIDKTIQLKQWDTSETLVFNIAFWDVWLSFLARYYKKCNN